MLDGTLLNLLEYWSWRAEQAVWRRLRPRRARLWLSGTLEPAWPWPKARPYNWAREGL